MDLVDKEIRLVISTHTPLAGRDIKAGWTGYNRSISTHTPLAGRDRMLQWDRDKYDQFLLTRPSRGATTVERILFFLLTFLLTRPSRGATPVQD